MGDVVSGGTPEKKRRSARAEVRKQDITRCAADVFAEHGYAQARMTDIAEAAGVTKGLLYWYFANKESLVAETLRDVHEQLRETQRASVREVEEPLDQVYVGTVASVRFVLENYRLFEVNVPFTDELREVYGSSAVVHAADTASTLAEGQRNGTIRADDPAKALALGNAGVVNQFCSAHAGGLVGGTIDDVAHMAARFLVRGLAADDEAAKATLGRHDAGRAKLTRRTRAKARA